MMDRSKLSTRPKSKTSTFLVTGGAGFIGSNITLALLQMGQRVRVLDDLSTGNKANIDFIGEYVKSRGIDPDFFEFIWGDIRNFSACRDAANGADFVLHQAALGSVPRSIADPVATNAVNIDGTLNMLIASKESKVKTFVFASSSSVYGDSEALPKKEGKEGNPLSPYAVTKAVGDMYLRIFRQLYNLRTVGLRYFNVFGPRQDPHSQYAAVIPLFIKGVLHGEPPTIFGDGDQSRDFTYVDNVVLANIMACFADKKAVGRTYNIACGTPITVNDLYWKICKIIGKELAPKYAKARRGDILHSNADITLAKEALSFEPIVDIEEGLKMTVEWYKANIK
jgi:UDP-N-acetylglucosamine 4-epimerase